MDTTERDSDRIPESEDVQNTESLSPPRSDMVLPITETQGAVGGAVNDENEKEVRPRKNSPPPEEVEVIRPSGSRHKKKSKKKRRQDPETWCAMRHYFVNK